MSDSELIARKIWRMPSSSRNATYPSAILSLNILKRVNNTIGINIMAGAQMKSSSIPIITEVLFG
jgi:hypothetical protein